MKDLVYLTTYRKNYVKKPIRHISRLVTEQEFADPITEGHRPFLFLHHKDLRPPQEDGTEYFERFKKHGKIEVDPKPLATNLILKGLQHNTEYQASICGSKIDKKKTAKITFPDDMVIQLTTQRTSFRNPLELMPTALDRTRIIKQSDNLSSNKKINEILKVKTGESEYMCSIGILGGFIVKAGKNKHDLNNR